MFVVRPIQDKELQKNICTELGAPYYENALAFFAADLEEDGSTIKCYISICQFYFNGNAEIINLTAADGRDDDEAVIVMLRAAMSFMHRCGVKETYFAKDSTSDHWLRKSGFSKIGDVYKIDLEKFYTSPCKYSEEK